MNIDKEPFGKLWGREASLYTLENAAGMKLKISDYGGIITHWQVPERGGAARDIVLGFEHFSDYLAGHPFFGCLVGRFANRIDAGRFTLQGKPYVLAAQASGNHLHGGLRGFDKYIWDSQTEQNADSASLILKLHSPDGDEGYPGALDVEVCYTLYADQRLHISYRATTDAPTIVNLTNHSYFNLGNAGDILDQRIQINATRYVEVDERQIPTGQVPELAASYLDCRQMRRMGDMFDVAPDFVVDHCYVLQESAGDLLHAATVEALSTGIRMKLYTDNVGVQFYNGNKIQNISGKNKAPYEQFAGFCVETQCFPDAPNQPNFPSCILLLGEVYTHNAEFCFESF